MTPVIGLVIAVVVGFVASSRRGVLIGVIPPMLAVTAAQSWYLGTGRGHNPPATTTDPAYWVVQLIILALIIGVATGIYAIRARRVSRNGGSLVPVRRGPGSSMLAAAIVAGFAATLALMFATDRPSHPGTGNGNLPVTGVVGIVVALLAIAVLGVLWLRNRPTRSGADVRELVG
jgi:peptidoglycan/LPS O-acetylase OafA/YrhL